MRLSVTEEIFASFPGALVGIAVAREITNAADDPAVRERLRRAQVSTGESFRGVAIAEHPRISIWREAYRRFGARPKDHPSSIENLVRRASKGQAIPHVNTLVDLYNAVSLERLLPAGAEDLDAIDGDVELAVASESEPPVRLLGEPEARPPRPGEVIYRDRAGAICRRWNWKEADRTKLSSATRNALVVVEGLPPISSREVEDAVEEIARSIREHCGGTVQTRLLDRGRPSVQI